MKIIFSKLTKFIYGILVTIFTIGISTIIVLNSQFIYHYLIDKYSLEKIAAISKDMLKNDFSTLIRYLQNPFIDKLKFENFVMSKNGEFHFYEVKKIFICISIITIVISMIFIVLLLAKKIFLKKINFYEIFNYGANTLIFIITLLLIVIVMDFSKAFFIFHKIFFNNDYWIFDERTDPIIKVLPEEVFMIYALVIIGLIITGIILYKLYYFYKKKILKAKRYISVK